jgi:hypothetical protein
MEVDGREASPMKAVLQELEALQSSFHEALDSYSARFDADVSHVQQLVTKEIELGTPNQGKIRDLRDMLTLLRHLRPKKSKIRRKDLRKYESVLEDLRDMVDRW